MNVIPKMQNYSIKDGKFDLLKLGKVVADPKLKGAAELVKRKLLSRIAELGGKGEKTVRVELDGSIEAESYRLSVSADGVVITAGEYRGVLYAVQSLRVLSRIDSKSPETELVCFEAKDSPKYRWRGVQLDESRHFFGVDAIKRLFELMSLHKLNVFHWHLTDDQGWRIKIKSYPLLTEIGGKRAKSGIHGWRSCDDDGTPHEGFYTQEQIKDLVDYATKLGIQIVPEIDMPAHFAAAFAAYSWLGCRDIKVEVPWYFGGKYPLSQGIKDWNRSACIGNPKTFEFIYKVIDEVCDLFPAPYFHIGGDEAPKDEWKTCAKCQKLMADNNLKNEKELQGYFINKINEYVESKGRRLIGWNEVLEGGNLDNTVIAQYWVSQRDKNVLTHLQNGGDIIMSKHQSFYFDMSYNQYPLKNTYKFTPYIEGITSKFDKQILGVEGEVWTEWIPSVEKMDLHLFPRMEALAEVAWYGGEKDFDEFLVRYQQFKPILDAYGVNYAEDEVAMPKGFIKRKKEMAVWFKSNQDRELEKNRLLKAKK